MKDRISLSKILSLAAALFAAGGVLAACTPGSSESSSSSPTSSNTSTSSTSDLPEWHEYINDIHLEQDYEGHNFFEDGIGEVTMLTHIDGDTTHFKCLNDTTGKTLKSRYYGVDTPESTGAIQDWGQSASDFTHHMLDQAKENGTIVVSSPFKEYKEPIPDSTGSRFLSLVWINTTKKHAPKEELTLLNLNIVQAGWSWAKNLSDIPEYVDTFQAAQDQAEAYKIGLWQGEDPSNHGDWKNISVLDLKREVSSYLQDNTYVNKLNNQKVMFTGVVAGYCDNTIYIQEECYNDPSDESQGMSWGGINIFTGMTAISSRFTEVGTYIRVHGTAKDSDTFGFQVTDTQGRWPASSSPDDEAFHKCQVLLTAKENDGEHALKVFEYTKAEQNAKIAAKDFENIYCRTHITENVVCNKFYINGDGDAITLGFEGCNFSAYLPFQYAGNPNDSGDIWNSAEKYIGKSFDLTGVLAYHKTVSGNITYQIIPCGTADMVCTTEAHGTTSGSPFTVSEAADAFAIMNHESVMSYYVKGKVTSATEVTTTSGTVTLSDGSKSINVNITGLKGVNASDIIEGSTISVFGKAINTNGGTLNGATVYAAAKHGTIADDPLTITEAVEIGSALDSGAYTTTIYYIAGRVTAIDTPYDTSSKRMTLTFQNGETMTVSPKMGAGVNYEDIVVGSDIVIRGKIYNNGTAITTYDNGTQVVSVVNN